MAEVAVVDITEEVVGLGAITQAVTVAVKATIQGVVEAIGVDFPEGVIGVLTGVAMEDVAAIHEEEDTPEVEAASPVVAAIPVEVAIPVAVATPEGSRAEATAEAPATTTTTLMTSMKSRMTSQLRTATLATPLVTSTSPTIQMTSMTSM